ncbi:MAG: hypothetical protein EXX96DRAFT_578930 [Benjaminiella poitrasii]|nr:MAG: hypothetical protein EXX96DRAFT_578930 [Benjaminiella poitrasii]
MKTDNAKLNPMENGDDEEDMEITTDIVEDFARQLDEIVNIRGDNNEEEEEEFNDDHFGYQALPQDEDEYHQLNSDEEDDCLNVELKEPLTIDLQPSERLSPETTDLIKSIMNNVQLSDRAIPGWAKKIPEHAWLPRVKKE